MPHCICQDSDGGEFYLSLIQYRAVLAVDQVKGFVVSTMTNILIGLQSMGDYPEVADNNVTIVARFCRLVTRDIGISIAEL